LQQYCLPEDFKGSSFALLGYTGAKLASDTFALYADYTDAKAPLDLVTELAGAKYYIEHIKSVREGDSVDLVAEPDNLFDKNAIQVKHNNNVIGYINRFNSLTLKQLDFSSSISASILRLTINDDTAKVFLLLRYR